MSLPLDLVVGLACLLGQGESDDDTFFRQDVLPVLEAHCFECHGPHAERIKGGLMMEGRGSLLTGGESGPAVVSGQPESSLLIQAIRWRDPLLEMPPSGRLDAASLATLTDWVARGIPWPVSPSMASDASDAPTAEPSATSFFEREVRPLLAHSCFECHGPDVPEPEGELRMQGRQSLLRGGSRGPSIVPGEPGMSLLIRAVRREDPDLQMPPDTHLSERNIRVLERWIADQAPWPLREGTLTSHLDDAREGIRAARQRWPFTSVERPEVPRTQGHGWVRNPIDAFVLARLESAGLSPNPPASARELVRRASFDLLGLPPTAHEVRTLETDSAEAAWSRFIDSLLQRPEYGERWGRHWLDVVRYAQTTGYEKDTEIPFAWRYRDYVIQSFNDDKPFDRFVLEQIAGDELDDVTDDALIATGFYRLGPWDSEPDDTRRAELDGQDDSLRTISEGFLGLTVGCARCHDHRFDPILQEDYYGMLAFLDNVRPYEKPRFSLDSATLRPLGWNATTSAAWERDRARHIEALKSEGRNTIRTLRRRLAEHVLDDHPAEVREALDVWLEQYTDEQEALLKQTFAENAEAMAILMETTKQLNQISMQVELALTSFEGDLEWALSARERGSTPPVTKLLVRGDPSLPAQETPPRFVQVACADEASSWPGPLPDPAQSGSTGRRRALGEWIASERNPLTARVIVNRVWQHHFDRGVVATPNNFGAMGSPPSHPGLLDWLASEFVQQGWSLKKLHRLIMSSNTYRMSSLANRPGASVADPDNSLLWRQRMRRLDAEELHDAILSVAGTLDGDRGGEGFFPEIGKGALAGGSRPGEGWGASTGKQRNRRAVYAFSKRNLAPPLFEIFDAANASLPVGVRARTTVASQALSLLNGAFANRQASAFAGRVRGEAGPDRSAQVRLAFQLALAREPSATETQLSLDFLTSATATLTSQAPEWTFASQVPPRVDRAFLDRLSGQDLLSGPREGWRYVAGVWGADYNGTVTPIEGRYPAALLRQPVFQDGVVRARMRLHSQDHASSLFLHSSVRETGIEGIEARLEPDSDRVSVLVWGEEQVQLAEARLGVDVDRWFNFRVRLQGPRFRMWIEDRLLLDVQDDRLAGSGRLSIRTWGEGLSLTRLELKRQDDRLQLLDAVPGWSEQEALELFCLSILNLNEFIYVD